MSKPIVEALFGTGAKSKVVQLLYLRRGDSGPLPGRSLAREAGIPLGSINKTLAELVKDQLVVREETAEGPRYRAPHEDPRLAGLFLLLRQDSDIVARLKRALKTFKSISYSCVFGSFAAGRAQARSDIDVLVLEVSDADRFAVMAALAKVSEKIGREVGPQFYAADEFLAKLEARDPVARSILANPRIDLKGRAPWQT